MNVKRRTYMLMLAAIFVIPRIAIADETQAQGLAKKATETVVISGGTAKERKPVYGLVLLLEVTEKNYDNFEEELITPNISRRPDEEYRNTFDISDNDWARVKEFPAQSAILDGFLYPSRDKFKINKEIQYDFPHIREKQSGRENPEGIGVRHPAVLVSWKRSMEGKGRKGAYFDFEHLFPVFSVPFFIETRLNRNAPMSSDLENACINITKSPTLHIQAIAPNGRTLVMDENIGNGIEIDVGEKWENTREMEYTGSDLAPSDKNDTWGMALFEKYAKGRTIKFRTVYVIKNRGFMLMKWPEIKGNK